MVKKTTIYSAMISSPNMNSSNLALLSVFFNLKTINYVALIHFHHLGNREYNNGLVCGLNACFFQ